MSIYKYIGKLTLAGLSAYLLSTSVIAQRTDNRSPYSRYGYGSQEGGYTSGGRALGGLSAGLRDGLITNPSNPASYTAVDSLTFIFDVGLSAKYAFLEEGGSSDKRLLGNLEYLTMLYPLSNRLAMSAGIMPLSSTGYSFGRSVPIGGDTNTNTFIRSYRGNGTYNDLYVGIGANVFAGLHIGANASYVFGHTAHQRQVAYANTGALNSIHTENLHLRGLKFTLGMQYELKLDTMGTRSIVVGASFSPQYSYMSERTVTQQATSNRGVSEIVKNETSTSGRYTSPDKLSVGLSYRVVGRWMLGVDVRHNQWSRAEFTDLEASFRDQWGASLGGEWTPNYRSRGLWKRSKYRLGLSYGTSYVSVPIGNTGKRGDYQEYGASLGFALPLVDRRSALNFSIDYKYLKPQSAGMVSEHYLGATIGIIFNESWFRKARVN